MMNSMTDAQIPTGLPVLPGVVLAGQYGLTECEPIDRGDTLSACVLGERRVALLVADVVGHGLSAALAAAQVRAILWSNLSDGASLADAVASLDRYAERHSDLSAATLGVAVLDLDDGTLDYAAAGLLPPLVLSPRERPRLLGASWMQPLGTRGQTHVQQTTLSPEDMVVLSTNGLVSNPTKGLRQASEDFGSIGARVLDESADRGALPPQRADDVGRALVAGYEPAGPCDDVALLVALRATAPRLLSVEMSVDTFDVADLRALLSDWLDELGAGLADHISLGHAMVELATNVAKHAYPDSSERARPIRISAMLDDAGDVVATVSDQGRWRVPDEQHHRGLTMAGGLVDSLQVHRSHHGTAVEIRSRLSRPVQLWRAESVESCSEFPDELSAVATSGHLAASGPIDEASAELFHSALIEATHAGTADATVDLTDVTHLSSPGVQSLFDLLDRSSTSGVHLSIIAPHSTPARQILDLVGLPAGP